MIFVATVQCLQQNCEITIFKYVVDRFQVNTLPDIPILGSSDSAANKGLMSKIWTNGDTNV